MRQLTMVLAAVLSTVLLHAQQAFSAKKITADKLPKQLKYQGKFKEAWQWKDKTGQNLLLLTKTAEHKSPTENEDERSAELYAYQFVKTDTGYGIVWKLSDFVKECPFDITLDVFKAGISITDLDKDSLAETTLVYKLSCRSDVSPHEMKLIMREGASKYALRGKTCDQMEGQKTCVSIDSLNLELMPKPKEEWEEYTWSAGRYQSEKDFKDAPPAFLPFARRQWIRFVNMF